MNNITCEYCGTKQEKKERCVKCGAPVSIDLLEKLDPFYYRGYMIWPEKYHEIDAIRFHIWLGDRRIYVFDVTRRDIYENVPEGCSYLSYVWGLIKVVLGEEEVLRIEQLNNIPPVVFEITKCELWHKVEQSV